MTNMNKFGTLKNKLLLKLTESYANEDKKTIKEILSVIKSDKNFKELYKFYESFEQQTFEDAETAKMYVDTISEMLKNKTEIISELNNKLGKILDGVSDEPNKLYENLDTLISNDNILNVANKVKAKKYLVEHLMAVKENNNEESDVIVENEKLLFAVLTSNFNAKFDDVLSEEEKNEFKTLMEMSDENVNSEILVLKEEISGKISNLLTECDDSIVAEKLKQTNNLVIETQPSKYNLFKLRELKNDL